MGSEREREKEGGRDRQSSLPRLRYYWSSHAHDPRDTRFKRRDGVPLANRGRGRWDVSPRPKGPFPVREIMVNRNVVNLRRIPY